MHRLTIRPLEGAPEDSIASYDYEILLDGQPLKTLTKLTVELTPEDANLVKLEMLCSVDIDVTGDAQIAAFKR